MTHADAAAFSRRFIPGDREIPPLVLSGAKRLVFLAGYCVLVATAIFGMGYTLYFNPLFAVATLAVAYYFENLAFFCGHLMFHAQFIEAREQDMGTLCHHSFVHHYRNTGIFHETWLETRMSYFFDAKLVIGPRTLPYYLVAALFLAPLVYFVPVLAVAMYSAVVGALLVQSTIHEWYHNPRVNRKAFYSFPVYWLFTALEKTGLCSTRSHTVHHRHGLNNLSHVENWLDMYIPFGEALPERIWRKALSLHEPGRTRMVDFTVHGLPQRLRMTFRVLSLILIIAAYFWIVPTKTS